MLILLFTKAFAFLTALLAKIIYFIILLIKNVYRFIAKIIKWVKHDVLRWRLPRKPRKPEIELRKKQKNKLFRCLSFLKSLLVRVLYRIFNKIYWMLHTLKRQIHISIRKNYNKIVRFKYADVFFICLRSLMKKGERSIKFIKIDSIVHYIQHHRDCRYILIEKAKERVVEKPAFFERCESEIVKFDSPEVYVAEILHVKLVGASNIIIVGNKLLNDTVYYDDDNRIDIRFSSVKKVISKIAVIETTTFNKYIPVAINLVAAASFNYYHLLVEILSKLAFVDTIVEFREYPILVDKIVIQIPQYKEALTCINKYNHPIITLDKEEGCQVERLICPSSNVWMPINVYHRNLITTKDFLISETVLLSIRNSVKLYQDKRPWRKIFISRKNTSAVRLENELEIRNLFVDDGFEIVYTEEMSFQQQIDTFGQAKIVVATSGAALTNIIFCQEKTTIGCIIPESHKFYMYSTIAYLLGMNTLFIDADVIKVTHYTAADTFLVDVDYAKRYLASLKQIVNTSN